MERIWSKTWSPTILKNYCRPPCIFLDLLDYCAGPFTLATARDNNFLTSSTHLHLVFSSPPPPPPPPTPVATPLVCTINLLLPCLSFSFLIAPGNKTCHIITSSFWWIRCWIWWSVLDSLNQLWIYIFYHKNKVYFKERSGRKIHMEMSGDLKRRISLLH